MNDNIGASKLHAVIKEIADRCLENRKITGINTGVYNGSAIVLSDRLPIPMSMVKGNLKNKLISGDKVVLLRNDGGQEYYILEITGKPFLINSGEY